MLEKTVQISLVGLLGFSQRVGLKSESERRATREGLWLARHSNPLELISKTLALKSTMVSQYPEKCLLSPVMVSVGPLPPILPPRVPRCQHESETALKQRTRGRALSTSR